MVDSKHPLPRIQKTHIYPMFLSHGNAMKTHAHTVQELITNSKFESHAGKKKNNNFHEDPYRT